MTDIQDIEVLHGAPNNILNNYVRLVITSMSTRSVRAAYEYYDKFVATQSRVPDYTFIVISETTDMDLSVLPDNIIVLKVDSHISGASTFCALKYMTDDDLLIPLDAAYCMPQDIIESRVAEFDACGGNFAITAFDSNFKMYSRWDTGCPVLRKKFLDYYWWFLRNDKELVEKSMGDIEHIYARIMSLADTLDEPLRDTFDSSTFIDTVLRFNQVPVHIANKYNECDSSLPHRIVDFKFTEKCENSLKSLRETVKKILPNHFDTVKEVENWHDPVPRRYSGFTIAYHCDNSQHDELEMALERNTPYHKCVVIIDDPSAEIVELTSNYGVSIHKTNNSFVYAHHVYLSGPECNLIRYCDLKPGLPDIRRQ